MRRARSPRFRPGLDALDARRLLSGGPTFPIHFALTSIHRPAAHPMGGRVAPVRAHHVAPPRPAPPWARWAAALRQLNARHATAPNPRPAPAPIVPVFLTASPVPTPAPVLPMTPAPAPAPVATLPMPAPVSVPVPLATPPAPVLTSPAPTSGPTATPQPTATMSSLERQIVDLTNQQRAQNGLPPLTVDSRLVEAAQIHAADMARLGQMEHDLPGAALPNLTDRAQFVGYPYAWLGENIAFNYADAPSVVAGWMQSPGHRANILNTNFTNIGVGVALDSQGEPYYCQVFGSQQS